tara:strand:+ start:6264 stop:8252 length:1989 start_codon:yes stop_codon:yes gene_type:complete
MITKLFIDGVKKDALLCKLKKEGDRAIDQLSVSVPRTVSLVTNQKVHWLQDYVTLDNLSAIYNFHTSVKDESGNNNNGTASNLTYGLGKWNGFSGIFNGSSTVVTVSDAATLDFSDKFDIIIWTKWASTPEQYLTSKRSSTSNGWAVSVNKTTAGSVTFKIGSTEITSSTAGYNDSEWHMIRVTRNVSNVITLYIDNVSRGTATVSTNLTDTNSLLIGKDFGGSFFNGEICRLRLYNNVITNVEATKLYNKKNPRSTMKFGGRITKIEDKTSHKEIIAQSFGKILGETEIRGESFDNRSPEYIVNNLMTNNSDFEYIGRGADSGIILGKYVADGKLIDIIRDFAALTNKIFYTTPTEQFIFEPKEFTTTLISLTHGVNASILDNGFDDTEIVNDLTVIGQILKYSTIKTETLSSANSWVLDHGVTTLKITKNGTDLVPEDDFTVDSVGKTVGFTSTQSGVFVAYYDYDFPVIIRGIKQSSIDEYGVHAKRMNLGWITNRGDGVRFVQSYLERYKEISQKVKVEIGEHENYISENDMITITNPNMGFDSKTFVVKSIAWNYPEMTTILDIGEYYFDYYEYDKMIIQKIHNLEGAISTIKEIREYESPEFIFTVTLSGDNITTNEFTETLNSTITPVIYDKSRATYASSNYGSRKTQDVYGSVA